MQLTLLWWSTVNGTPSSALEQTTQRKQPGWYEFPKACRIWGGTARHASVIDIDIELVKRPQCYGAGLGERREGQGLVLQHQALQEPPAGQRRIPQEQSGQLLLVAGAGQVRVAGPVPHHDPVFAPHPRLLLHPPLRAGLVARGPRAPGRRRVGVSAVLRPRAHPALQVLSPGLHGGHAGPARSAVAGPPRLPGGALLLRGEAPGGRVAGVVAQADAAGPVAAAAAPHGAAPAAAGRAGGEAGPGADQHRLLEAERRARAQGGSRGVEEAPHAAASGHVRGAVRRMGERRGPGDLPQVAARAQPLVEQRLLQREALVPLVLGEVAGLRQAASGSRAVARGRRVRRRDGERRRLSEELLPPDQLLELQGVAPLVEGCLGAERPLGVALGAQAGLAPQVGVHAVAEVTGSSLLGRAAPQRRQGGRVRRRLAVLGYGARRGGGGR
ncbi:hypothetical protein EYF80_017767 [Liparis tanakae]|uniref:Uncharacterized protein n=1 Tax=Liparis tanakae TaxID=230148 RepID=A0A4Z2I1M9_9TELE|nr:hypothetical protein EYF80_017767 [Liparis tanakae]